MPTVEERWTLGTTVEKALQWLNEHGGESAESEGAASMDAAVDAFHDACMHAAAAVAPALQWIQENYMYIYTYVYPNHFRSMKELEEFDGHVRTALMDMAGLLMLVQILLLLQLLWPLKLAVRSVLQLLWLLL